MNRLIISLFTALLTCSAVWSAVPAGYYSTCEGKSGKALLQQLYSVIGNHTTISYSGLWDLYKTSDIKDNGKIWDMYSTKEWNPGKEQCGTYSAVGDCYNREHSFPKSWFNDASPMVSDAFHIYPTDGKVNGQRNNYPYGECSGGTTLSSNGSVKALGRLGKCTFQGYSGTVFEPVDEYKGDFARSYFYMAACYNDRISGWSSDMLAGNNYPAFSSWALNLLLKWHRQDPVSEKEIKRNDVVYGHQKNRNPFIDHPELVEHIWGNKSTVAWNGSGETEPKLVLPVDGSVVELGVTGLGVKRTVSIPVKGSDLKNNVTVSVSGTGFSTSVSTLTASAVNSGTSIDVSFVSASVITAAGRLVLTSGDAKTMVELSASAVNGIPALPAFDVTETSFRAAWVNVDGNDAIYQLSLYVNDELLSGYPVDVYAQSEWEDVDGLEPGTTYTYTLSNGKMTSNVISVTTASPIPSIQFLYDGELEFVTSPGVPSDVAELLLEIDNIAGDIAVSVSEPFEVSTDKDSWGRSVVIPEGEDRVYMRLYGENPGSFSTVILATAGDYMSDDAEATGVITSGSSKFCEDFEASFNNSYTSGSYDGTMGAWKTNDAGIWDADKSKTHSGSGVCRFGNTSGSYISTATPKAGGIGVVSFYGERWSAKDGNANIAVQYSPDGLNWTDAGTVTISTDSYESYSVAVNKAGSLYLRLQQVSGKRCLIDDITVSDYSGVSAVDELYYHSWDAFCRDGRLVIENGKSGQLFTVYGVDGIEYFSQELAKGEVSLSLAPGLYIVVADDFSRRVLIR